MERPALCPHCGAQISTDARFCRTCGKSTATNQSAAPRPVIPPTERKCPHCGAPVSPNAKFCRACGKMIEPFSVPAQRDAAKPGAAATPSSQIHQLQSVSQVAGQVASVLSSATTMLPLGWQTVVGSTLPAIAPLATNMQSVLSRQTTSVGRSLRAPVIGLAATSFIAMVTTLATRDTTAQLLACVQFGLTMAGLVTGLIASKQRNLISLGTVLATLGVFQVQGCSLCTLVQTTAASRTSDAYFALLVSGSTQFLCLVTALGTAWTAARGGKR